MGWYSKVLSSSHSVTCGNDHSMHCHLEAPPHLSKVFPLPSQIPPHHYPVHGPQALRILICHITRRRASIPTHHKTTLGLSMSKTSGRAMMPERANCKTAVSPWRRHHHTYLFHYRSDFLVNEQGVRTEVIQISCCVEGLPEIRGRMASQAIVSTTYPDPFCRENGLAPEGYVAVFCTSNHTGGKLQHHHIPAQDLSPAPPRKKHQQCLVLDGPHRRLIVTISKCSSVNRTVEYVIAGAVASTLSFDQICLVEPVKYTIE